MEWLRNEQIKRENEDASQRPRLLKTHRHLHFLVKRLYFRGKSTFLSFVFMGLGNHSIFRHDNFIGCFSADKIKMSARK